MGKIIKFLNHDEIIENEPRNTDQYLLGFYRINDDTVLYCSIVKDDEGFEYYYDCNRNWAESLCPDNSYPTYEKCYEAMMKDISRINETPRCIGRSISSVTKMNLGLWNNVLHIEEKYPIGGLVIK